MIVIRQHRRNDAASAVGWRCYHTATGGVFFVNGEGEHVDPVHDVHRIDVVLITRYQ
ncbi:hypothetical protein D3C85_1947440 [compost metagenome]